MKNINYLFLLLSSLALFSSCEKLVIGNDEINTPENNFEILWQDFDEHYGLFVARGWDWDSIYTEYRPQVNPQTTDDELWTIFTEMLGYLDDGHTSIKQPSDDSDKIIFFGSGSELSEETEEEFSLELIEKKYTEQLKYVPLNKGSDADLNQFSYGKVKNKNIGYIYLGEMEYRDPNYIDKVIAALNPYDAIILDLRDNGGGEDFFSERIAGAFADGEHFIYTVQEKNGPGKNDFNDKTSYYTKPEGNTQYLKPVIILTDRATISAGEIFLLHMNAFAQVTQMGDATAGDFSDAPMRGFLPNGWIYRYSLMMYLLPDGTSLDGIGHIPDVYIKNTKADIEAKNDLVMEKAIQYLFDTYGIE